MAVAGSSFGGVALRYVLPVLWMTSRLAIMGRNMEAAPPLSDYHEWNCDTGRESDIYDQSIKIYFPIVITENYNVINAIALTRKALRSLKLVA